MAKIATLFERRWLRRTCYAIATTFVVLVLALWLGGPPAARWAIETIGSRALGRTVRVGAIRVNPFTLTLRIADLAIEGAAGEDAPLLAIGALRASLSGTSLWHRAPVVRSLAIDRIRAHIVRLEAQRFNFSDIVDRVLAQATDKPAPPPGSQEPARFALHNIEIADSALDFDDRVQGQAHSLQQIRIAIPFISSLPTDVEIYVKPAFFAQLDGHPLELNGETRPFEQSLETSIDLKFDGLDVPKYLSYSPVPLRFRVPSGALDADLRVTFRRAAAGATDAQRPLQLIVSGPIALRDFELDAPAGAEAKRLLAWKRLAIAIDELAVFDKRLRLSEVALEGPEVEVTRDAAGRVNWIEFLAAPVATAPKDARETTEAAAATRPPAQPFDASVAALRIADGRVRFSDATAGTFVKRLDALTLDVRDISTVSEKPATLKLAAHTADGESLGADGEVQIAQRAGKIAVTAKEVDVKALAPYLEAVARGRFDARVDAGATLEFDAATTPAQIRATEVSVAARKVHVEGPQEAGAQLDVATLAIEGGSVDVAARSAEVAKIAIDGPRAIVTRLADGSIGWTHLAETRKAPGDAAASSPPSEPWRVRVAAVELNRGDVQFADRTVDPPVTVQIAALTAKARNLSADGAQRAQFNVRAHVGKLGSIAVDGNARWDRLAAVLQIDARSLEVPLLRSYIARELNVEFASAEVSTRGTLTIATVAERQTIDYRGDLQVANLHVLNPGGAGDLLKWNQLSLERCGVRIGDGAPVFEVGALALSDFFANVVLSEDGRLNLREVPRTVPEEASSAPKPTTAGGTPPVIRVGGIRFERGNVNFTDHFVKPNYTVNLTHFAGTVGALSSDNAAPAEADLKAQLDDEAPVQIKGKLNPLAPQLFLDIAASAHGIDLPRFTPYSAKYAGYPITKGKLSVDVSYKVDGGKLVATNRLFLDQLTFGDHVDSPTATKLPVLFAVSLLKNSRGEIDINLPISGSLNDPDFSVGGIILQVIVNLITKAVTAPFALLASAFGTGEEIGYVEFAPGSAALAPAQEQRLATLAKALADRPALRLDVIGRVDPAQDTEALRSAKYEAKLHAAKVRELVRAGGASIDPGSVKVEAAERPALIASAYKDEKLPDKPRNMLGIAKSIPAPEMEQRLLAAITVGPDDLRKLALDRADAVRNQLETTGKIARERMFLVEPKLTPEGIADKGATTRVDFSIK
ncbi:MAG TPA: DUF748 domain-containing protein [Burkholderiaceae bacterium]|nr:DUF748 domain-containing protein [Burkholderiaceae bacterium]